MYLNTAGRSFAKRSGKKYENPENTLRLKKDKNNGGVRVDWPYPHAVEIPPKISAPSFIGYLKENSSTMINEQLGELRYKIQELGFRRRGYYMYNRMR